MASDASAESGDGEVATAAGQHVPGRISLGKAAERVDVTRWGFETFLREAGFTALYGPRSPDQLTDEIDPALDTELLMASEEPCFLDATASSNVASMVMESPSSRPPR